MSTRTSIALAVGCAVGLLALVLGVTGAWAGPEVGPFGTPLVPAVVVSDTISYQGRLLDGDGDPVDGTRVMTFSLYAASSGGGSLWSDAFPVSLDKGLFNAYLDVDPALFDGQALWLGVQVEGETQEMTPRQPLLPAPYAFSLRPGATVSGSLPIGSGGVLRVVNSDASSTGSYAISAVNHSEQTWRPAIYGENQGASAGVYGRGDGWNAVVGWNVSPQWAGVYGRNIGTGSGVHGHNTGGAGAGVRGESADGFGVAGYSENDVAVYGEAVNGTSAYFTSTHGVGVHANTPSDNAAVLAEGGRGPGVVGYSAEGPGGLFATGGSGEALLASGSVRVTGDLTVTGQTETGKVVYPQPRTHYFVVGGEAFVPGSNVDYRNSYETGGAYIYSGSGALVAPVHLPHNAVVISFEVFFYDGSTSDMVVYLQRLVLDGGGYQRMAEVPSSGTSGYNSSVDTTISYATIDNTAYGYNVYAWSDSWSNSFRIMGAVLTYTITEAP